MIPGLNDVLAPDMQIILLFLLPTLAAIGVLVMNMRSGFSTAGTAMLVLLSAIALYFAPDFIALL